MRGRRTNQLAGIALAILCAATAWAQQGAASLRVTVVDPDGAAVPNAQVSVGKQEGIATNARGEAVFERIGTGKAQLRVTAPGFAPQTIKGVALKPGPNQLQVRLEIATVEEQISVERDKREAATDPRSAFATVLTEEQIAQLPDDPEEFEQAIRNMAGPGANFRVNGFRGGKLPPKNQIREIRFRTNAFAAENHESSFISVDIYTKPGLDAWHGSANVGFRDEALNGRNAFAPIRAPEQNRRFGFELGGPVWKKHTSLFLSADGVNSFEAKTLVAALPDRPVFDQIRQPWRTLNLNARLEHLTTKTHVSRVEFQRNATRRDNNGVGNFDFAERGYTTDSVESLLRFADSGVVGKKLFNEIRFQARWQTVDLDALSNAVTIQVLNAFTRGGAQVYSSRRVRELELADNLDLPFKKHSARMGFQVEGAGIRSRELRNLNGTFLFSSLAAYQAGQPATYTRRSGPGAVDFDQYQVGWYAQDDWRVTKGFSLSLGLRHELQTNMRDRNNLMPRVGFAWAPGKKGNTTIRGGGGIFYDWFASDIYEQSLRVDGRQQIDTVILHPGFPDPLAGGAAVALAASRIQVDPRLRLPYVAQATTGLERVLPGNLRLMTQYSFRRGLHQLRGRNVNAPVDGVRPDPLAGNVTQIESSASSTTHMAFANLNYMKMGKFFVGANYTWSRSVNETDSPLSLPADNLHPRADRGFSLQDIRHRFFMISNFTLPYRFRLGTILQATSAPPYNITTGLDNNGDSTLNDRPAGVARNSARGAGLVDLSTRLSWGFSFGKKPEGSGGPQVRILRGDGDSGSMLGSMGSLPGANDKRYRTEFYVQATNVINHVNPIAFSGVLTSPFFGQPTAAMPGRRIETGMRFSF